MEREMVRKKRHNARLRMTDGMHAAIAAAAIANGRSVSEEIERRLEMSVTVENVVDWIKLRMAE